MNDGQINYEELEAFWNSTYDARDTPPPSSGMMTLGTARYIASKMGENYQIHPALKEVFENPEYSDSMIVEFVGESFLVSK